jgi:hypothetical protein
LPRRRRHFFGCVPPTSATCFQANTACSEAWIFVTNSNNVSNETNETCYVPACELTCTTAGFVLAATQAEGADCVCVPAHGYLAAGKCNFDLPIYCETCVMHALQPCKTDMTGTKGSHLCTLQAIPAAALEQIAKPTFQLRTRWFACHTHRWPTPAQHNHHPKPLKGNSTPNHQQSGHPRCSTTSLEP